MEFASTSQLSCSALSLQPADSLHLKRVQYTSRTYLSAFFPWASHFTHCCCAYNERPKGFFDCVWTCFVTGIFRNLSTHCHLRIAIKSTLKIWLPSIGSFSHHGPRDNSKAEASALLKRDNFFLEFNSLELPYTFTPMKSF